MTAEEHSAKHQQESALDSDIREALNASHGTETQGGSSLEPAGSHSAALADTSGKRWGWSAFAMMKCGLMAEKYPWQTVAALLITVGCGWVCTYFGATVLAALLLYAVYTDD